MRRLENDGQSPLWGYVYANDTKILRGIGRERNVPSGQTFQPYDGPFPDGEPSTMRHTSAGPVLRPAADRAAIDEQRKSDRAGAVLEDEKLVAVALGLLGLINEERAARGAAEIGRKQLIERFALVVQ